ncbi:hypothetical protein ACM66B_002125 [Microbotryomycetes sp. NB124-2]
MQKVWIVVGCWRALNALVSRSFFQPDEYWQSLEVAHRIVFGYGFETWEWRTTGDHGVGGLLQGGRGGIRSAVHPMMFVPILWTLELLRLDDTALLTVAPRLLQAIFAVGTDWATYKAADRLLGRRYAQVALLCSVTNFFHFQALTRTFSNSVETALTAVALSLWPWPMARQSGNSVAALAAAALACVMRPSNAVIWSYLGCVHLAQAPPLERTSLIRTTLNVGLLAITLSFIIDSLFYGTPTLTPLRFLHENVLNSISLFYGANPAHFYLSQGLVVTLLTQLPFTIHGLYLAMTQDGNPTRHIAGAATFTLVAYSLLSHKEWRFIHPLVPMLNVLASMSLVRLANTDKAATVRFQQRLPVRLSHALALVVALVPAVYLTSFHGLAQISVMNYLRSLPPSELRSAAFLMPCHSTPWQSHLHRPDLEQHRLGGSGEGGRLWFVTCEPPVLGQNATTYRDQSDVFYESPATYLFERFPREVDPEFPPSPVILPDELARLQRDGKTPDWRHEWPSHIVVFEALLQTSVEKQLVSPANSNATLTIRDVLAQNGYVEIKRLWNSVWHEDERRRGDVVVLRWRAREE